MLDDLDEIALLACEMPFSKNFFCHKNLVEKAESLRVKISNAKIQEFSEFVESKCESALEKDTAWISRAIYDKELFVQYANYWLMHFLLRDNQS